MQLALHIAVHTHGGLEVATAFLVEFFDTKLDEASSENGEHFGPRHRAESAF